MVHYSLIEISGLDPNDFQLINFDDRGADYNNRSGMYHHSDSNTWNVSEGTTWINPNIITPGSVGQTGGQRVMNIIVHELRHAYQFTASDNRCDPNSDSFEVTDATRNVWYDNRQDFTSPPRPLPDNASEARRTSYDEQMQRYREQPLERDARGFVDAVTELR